MSYKWYGDMQYQRARANSSPVCNCCGGRRIRERRRWPLPQDPGYVGAVCPECDVAP